MPHEKAYAALSLPYPRGRVTHDAFLEMLQSITPRAADIEARILPASFDASPTMPAFLRHFSWRWDTLAEHLKHVGTVGLLVRIPLLWQCEPLIHHACRESGSFFFLNDEANMPVGRIALRDGGMDTVLTTAADAVRFAEHLRAAQAALPTRWIVIHPITHPLGIPDGLDAAWIAHEVHIFPGIPLFVQCSLQRGKTPASFHLAEGFSYTAEGICGTEHDVLPLVRYDPPSSYRESGQCACGSMNYRCIV